MPTPTQVLLVVEIADETLEYDREVKGPIYAENGIIEYWLVNLIDKCIEVYRDPQRNGTYGDLRTFRSGDAIA